MKRILAVLAATALLVAGAAWPTTTSVAGHAPRDPGDARTHQHRQHAAGSARVAEGSALREPNAVTPKQAAALEARQRQILDRSGLSVQPRANGSVSIPVDFHGVTDRRGRGFVSLERIHRQIQVLNRAFGGRTGPKAANTPFRFHLASITRTKNREWYTADAYTKKGLASLREMRRELRVGNQKHLNLYTVGPKFQLLGFATLPGYGNDMLDGVVIWGASMPGGKANLGPGDVYNQGDTATHEIGHWLNLYHTFAGGCGKRNDYVTDTPRQKAGSNIFEEDTSLDTCGNPGGPKDPVRNFMNYAEDPFLNQFTRGQRERMDTAWYIRQALSN